MVGIVDELNYPVGEEGGVGEVAEGKLRKEKIAVTDDLKRAHLLSTHLEDGDCGVGKVAVDGFLEFFCEGEVS